MKKTIILSIFTGTLLFVVFELYNNFILYYKDEITIKYLSYNVELLQKQENNINIDNDFKSIMTNINILQNISVEALGNNVNDINSKINIVNGMKDYKDYNIKVIDSAIYRYYNKLLSDKYNELLKTKDNINQIRKLGLYKEKGYIDNHIAFLQKYKENSCMFYSINNIMKYEYGKELNIDLFYKTIGKNKGDYWNSGYFIKTGKIGYFSGSSDYQKLTSIGIDTFETNNLDIIQNNINNNKIGIFEGPLKLFKPNYKGNIWHAVAILKINGNIITYSDSLDGKIKDLDISEIKDNNNLYYPIKFLYINNNTFIKSINNLYNI